MDKAAELLKEQKQSKSDQNPGWQHERGHSEERHEQLLDKIHMKAIEMVEYKK